MKTSFVMLGRTVSIVDAALFSVSAALAQVPQVGPNINMVTGTRWPAGDPFLTKQNEPSHAISSLNSQHLLAGANDYRMVINPLAEPSNPDGGGDAWVYVYKSVDGGATWFAEPISGCPFNIPACNSPVNQPVSPVKGLGFAADPTVRAGPYGTFFYSFIAGNRGTGAGGVTAVQRFIDKNNNKKIGDDPFSSDVVNILDIGTAGQFKDKPWNVADVPARPWNLGQTCVIPGYNNSQPVPAFYHFVSYANFTGQGQNQHPQILVARSRDCGTTYDKPVKLSNSLDTNSGSSMAIDPASGTVYAVWRRFGDPGNGKPDAVYLSKSIDGGNTWDNGPTLVALINPFDQFINNAGTQFRTEGFPIVAVSVDGAGKSRVHVAWAQRKTAVDPATFACPPNANCDARIAIATSSNGGTTWSAPSYVDDWTSDPANPYNPGRGHQVQPALTFAGGKLLAVWLDQRYDHTRGVLQCPSLPSPCVSVLDRVEVREPLPNAITGQVDAVATVFTPFISDGTPGLTRRHTLDVFAAMADLSGQLPALDASGNPTFGTPAVAGGPVATPVSRYVFGSPKGGVKGTQPVVQKRFNAVNVPIFVNNTQPFLGDYIDVAAQTIIATGNPALPYQFNTGGTKPVFHVAWTDNRDVVPPFVAQGSSSNNTWTYSPIAAFITNPDGTIGTTLNGSCAPGLTGTRNQNIYTALLSDGAAAFANANSKLLPSGAGQPKPRGFVVTVQNLTNIYRDFNLTINAPAGVTASFAQDLSLAATSPLLVTVPPRSTMSRTVWVKAQTGSEKASITVNVTDATGTLAVLLNPDPQATLITNAGTSVTTQDLANLDITNVSVKTLDLTNNDITNQDLANLNLSANDITNQELANLDIANLDLTNQDIANQDITNNDITNLDLTNQDIANQDIANQDIANNDITNQDIANSAFADSTFTVQNTFVASSPDSGSTTDATVDTKTLLRNQQVPTGFKMQLVLRKIALNPTAVRSCRIGLVQQNDQISSNIVNITGVNDTGIQGLDGKPAVKPASDDNALGIFDPTDANAMTLPLSAGERAHLTLRILGPTQTDGSTFAQNGEKFVAIGAGGVTTSIPLIIKTLSLPPVIVHDTAILPVTSFGGTGTITWTLQSPTPSWVTLGSTTGATNTLVINKPPATGTFTVAIKLSDQSVAFDSQGQPTAGSDVEQLQLVVTKRN